MNDLIVGTLITSLALAYIIFKTLSRNKIRSYLHSRLHTKKSKAPVLKDFDMGNLVSVSDSGCYVFSLRNGKKAYCGSALVVTGVPGYDKERFFIFVGDISIKMHALFLEAGMLKYYDDAYGAGTLRNVLGSSGWFTRDGKLEANNVLQGRVEASPPSAQISVEVLESGMLIISVMNRNAVDEALSIAELICDTYAKK